MSNEETVICIYNRLLQRDPDIGGLETYVGVLNEGKTKTYVENCIRNSEEYKQLKLKIMNACANETTDPNLKIILYDLYLSRTIYNDIYIDPIVVHIKLNTLSNIHSLCRHICENYKSKIIIYNHLNYKVHVENCVIHEKTLENKSILSKIGLHVCLDNNFNDTAPLVLHNLWDVTHFEIPLKQQKVNLENKVIYEIDCKNFLWHG